MLDRAQVLGEIDDVLGRYQLQVEHRPRGGRIAEQVTSLLALIDRVTGLESSYRRAVDAKLDHFPLDHEETLWHVQGVTRALRADIEAGYTRRLEELVHG